jgi:hypothetical protein
VFRKDKHSQNPVDFLKNLQHKEGILETIESKLPSEVLITYLLYYNSDPAGIPLTKRETYANKHILSQLRYTFFVKANSLKPSKKQESSNNTNTHFGIFARKCNNP